MAKERYVNVPPMSAGSYFGHTVLYYIPIIGLLFLLAHSFGANVNPHKKNHARATLLTMIIGTLLFIISCYFVYIMTKFYY